VALTRTERRVPEGTTPIYRATLYKENGVDVIALADMTSMVMTLYNDATEELINSRDHVDVLNANGGTLDATSGAFEMAFEAEDMTVVNADVANGEADPVYALFQWELTNGQKGSHQVKIDVLKVANLEAVVIP